MKRGRTLGALLPIVVAVAAQAAYTLLSQHAVIEAGLESDTRSLASLMVNVVGPSLVFDDAKAVDEGLAYVTSDPDFAFAAALGSDGHTIAMRGAAESLHPVTVATTLKLDGMYATAMPVISDSHQVGTIYVGLTARHAHDQAMRLAAWATLISIIGIITALSVVRLLARRIEQRNRQMRLVLDHVSDGLATVQVDGTLAPQCSAAFVRWFGAAEGHFADRLAGDDATARAMLALSWDELVSGAMPLDVVLAQFPTRARQGDRQFNLDVTPLLERGAVTGALLRITDITDELETRRQLQAQSEAVAVFEYATTDPHGVRETIDDVGAMIDGLRAPASADIAARSLHTIKGNAAMLGLDSIALLAHQLEDRMHDGEPIDVDALAATWAAFRERALRLIDGMSDRGDTVNARLARVHAQIAPIAARLGKPAPEVIVTSADIELDHERLRGFWAAFGHVVRNAVDHGIESVDERRAAGKPDAGHIELRARRTALGFEIEIADDGRGIAWDRLSRRARDAGLPAQTPADLERALFASGVSTADEVTQISGRGVGLAAVDAAVRAAGGTITVASTSGRGTRFTFAFADDQRFLATIAVLSAVAKPSQAR